MFGKGGKLLGQGSLKLGRWGGRREFERHELVDALKQKFWSKVVEKFFQVSVVIDRGRDMENSLGITSNV